MWLLIFWFAGDGRMTFLLISALALVVFVPLAYCCIRRWRQMDDQEAFRDAVGAPKGLGEGSWARLGARRSARTVSDAHQAHVTHKIC